MKQLYKAGDQVRVIGDITNEDYDTYVDTTGVVETDQTSPRASVMVTLAEIDGDGKVTMHVKPDLLSYHVPLPPKAVLDGAKAIAKRLKAFLKENKLGLHYNMAEDAMYFLPKTGWSKSTAEEIEAAMEKSGKLLTYKDMGINWDWFRLMDRDESWYCNKGGKHEG